MNFKNITLGQVINCWEIMKMNWRRTKREEKKTRVNGIELPNRIKTKPFSDFLPQSM